MERLPMLMPTDGDLNGIGRELRQAIQRLFRRSLHIRHVDAGSCNACESEIKQLTSPYYDLHRLGIFFVTSPRHADLLLVTGPVTRAMEAPLRRAYDAMPDPRLVVAVGACACSGGVFGASGLTRGGLANLLPVDVYIPGCPPTPFALIHGLLLAIARSEQKVHSGRLPAASTMSASPNGASASLTTLNSHGRNDSPTLNHSFSPGSLGAAP